MCDSIWSVLNSLVGDEECSSTASQTIDASLDSEVFSGSLVHSRHKLSKYNSVSDYLVYGSYDGNYLSRANSTNPSGLSRTNSLGPASRSSSVNSNTNGIYLSSVEDNPVSLSDELMSRIRTLEQENEWLKSKLRVLEKK